MKTNRTSRNGSALRATKQAATKHSSAAPQSNEPDAPWWNHKLHILISGNGKTEDYLWASPEGLLYLHDGSLSTEPREITFNIAREWWKKFHDPRFEFEAPFFKEDTAAARLVSMVTDDWQARQKEAPRKLAPPNLEDAVRESAALTALLSSHMAHPQGEEYICGLGSDTFNCGLMMLCDQTSKRLLEAFYGRKGGV